MSINTPRFPIPKNGSLKNHNGDIGNGSANDLQIIQKSTIPTEDPYGKVGQHERIAFLMEQQGININYLNNGTMPDNNDYLKGNIENFIGMTQVPTGIVGPLRVDGSAAKGDYFVPLATTEGTLVASYNRGVKAILLSGGATSICIKEGVQRCPLFKFTTLREGMDFVNWTDNQLEKLIEITKASSRFAKLTELKSLIEGNQVIITLEFETGDASGQNMVTFCTEEICRFLIQNSPVKPVLWYIESNYSGDKKATANAFINSRGKRVISEARIPENVVLEVLKTTPAAMAEYTYASTIGAILSGAIGAQGHFANGLAALFLACGQDIACVSEASVGVTRMEVTSEGSLYISVTLPNLIVGTVGGGTSLPTQQESLRLMDCEGKNNARKFAEICGALLLAGELSIVAAISSGQFTSAHKSLGRKI